MGASKSPVQIPALLVLTVTVASSVTTRARAHAMAEPAAEINTKHVFLVEKMEKLVEKFMYYLTIYCI